MDKKRLLEKIYFKLAELDFDQLSFHNHILIDEVIEELKQVKNETIDEDLPPPLPIMTGPSDTKILKFKKKKESILLRLMVLDEDINILSLVEYSLRNEPQIALICEKSPRNALKTISEQQPDIILLDVMMKEMTCYEFMSQLKMIEGNKNIEIIVGSGHPNQHEKNASLELGAYDYISKPYDLIEMGFKLKMRLEKKKKQCG